MFVCNLALYMYIQLTEVGTMNIFVHWINENGGVSLYNDVIIIICHMS